MQAAQTNGNRSTHICPTHATSSWFLLRERRSYKSLRMLLIVRLSDWTQDNVVARLVSLSLLRFAIFLFQSVWAYDLGFSKGTLWLCILQRIPEGSLYCNQIAYCWSLQKRRMTEMNLRIKASELCAVNHSPIHIKGLGNFNNLDDCPIQQNPIFSGSLPYCLQWVGIQVCLHQVPLIKKDYRSTQPPTASCKQPQFSSSKDLTHFEHLYWPNLKLHTISSLMNRQHKSCDVSDLLKLHTPLHYLPPNMQTTSQEWNIFSFSLKLSFWLV